MSASFGPKGALLILALLVTACSVYGADLVDGGGSAVNTGGEGEGGSSAGKATMGGTAAAGKAGNATGGTNGGSAGTAGAGGGGGGEPIAMEPYLSGDLDTSSPIVVLSSEGSSDWMHWGYPGPESFNHKADAMSQRLEFKSLGATSAVAAVGGLVQFSWNNGNPTQAATTHAAISWVGEGEGFELKIPAVAEERVARLYLAVKDGSAQFSAVLSEPGVEPYEETLEGEDDAWQVWPVVLDYGFVGTADATLTISLSLTTGNSASAAVSLGAVTIAKQ